ncbi:hypothetical protein F3Y22_tig00110299pilonHSYRG00075 [Hibiscus syriacus]|uniref:BRCT domain-containing protein n=1 Tax=Hibiscus syriacus TaxID=106335 RepID=A0A6A3B4Y1_HIBSY|nr:hypothetical protein F3Y22_tig00110299pilonHSYRG00075 [Hibiscus syriacus]
MHAHIIILPMLNHVSWIKYRAEKRHGEIIHYSWVLDCCSQKKLIPLQPKYFLFLSELSRMKLQQEVDEYSDPYYWDLDLADLKQLFFRRENLLWKKGLHVLGSRWLENCLEQRKKLQEDQYSLKPCDVEETNFLKRKLDRDPSETMPDVNIVQNQGIRVSSKSSSRRNAGIKWPDKVSDTVMSETNNDQASIKRPDNASDTVMYETNNDQGSKSDEKFDYAMLLDMIPGLGIKHVETMNSVVENEKPRADNDAKVPVVEDEKGDADIIAPPPKKKKVSYKNVAGELLKD